MADSDIPSPPWHRGEPVAIVAALTAILVAIAPFLHWDSGVIAGVNAAIVAIAGVFLRQNVTPS